MRIHAIIVGVPLLMCCVAYAFFDRPSCVQGSYLKKCANKTHAFRVEEGEPEYDRTQLIALEEPQKDNKVADVINATRAKPNYWVPTSQEDIRAFGERQGKDMNAQVLTILHKNEGQEALLTPVIITDGVSNNSTPEGAPIPSKASYTVHE